jgi:ADP-dependent NAD(P)H-hydrate dehydratase / NAD(P)H-hydrate epimerase
MSSKILYSHWMQELDAKTINGIGIPSVVLMEKASQGAADFFAREFPLPRYRRVIVMAGKGNNGGDGLAAGRILAQKGYQVEFVLLTSPERLNPDPGINFQILKNLGLRYTVIQTDNQLEKIKEILACHHPVDTFVIDAIFGTGLNKPIRPGLFSRVIQELNNSPFQIAAIDLPSGLSEQFLPREGIHVEADVTAALQSLKVAHLYPDGNKHCGKIQIIDIGIPYALIAKESYYLHISEPGDFCHLLKKREIDAHKGTYGHSLTICGSLEKPGAGILSSFAVLKCGAGLCTAAVPPENRTLPSSVHPELMTLVYEKNTDLLQRLKEFNAILIGPGLGNHPETAEVVSLMVEHAAAPLVLDADALNVLDRERQTALLKKNQRQPIILTPHPGEFSRLTGHTLSEIRKDRLGLCREFAREYNVYVILKGHHTLLATPGGRVYLNPTGNPGMATAGSGDVLSGMVTGLISQSLQHHPQDLEYILQAAIFIHGYAADLAVKETGEISLTAADITRFIPHAFQRLHDYQTPFPVTC